MYINNSAIPILKNRIFQIIVIIFAGIFSYSNSLNVPFHLDDVYIIEQNPIIKNLNYIFEPSTAKEFPLFGHFIRRYISYITFALNYNIHGLDVTGYHIFNIFVHIINALLIYSLVLLSFKTPFLSESGLCKHARMMAFLISLIFVTHPVNTEAVTYISQRMASLATMFYLLSLSLYARFRNSSLNEKHSKIFSAVNYFLILVLITLAVNTKEIALTLPITILLYEFLFFNGPKKIRTLIVLPLFSPLIFYYLSLVESGFSVEIVLFGTGNNVSGLVESSYFDSNYINPSANRWPYFITQFRVIITYLRLLLVPVNQNLIYDYPLYTSFFNKEVLLSFVLLISIVIVAIYCYTQSKKGDPGLRLISFCIAWFFFALAIESSIIPLPLLICEYRLYLPGIAMLIAMISGMFILIEKIKTPKITIATISSLVILALVFSSVTMMRNNVWRSKISLWEDIVKKTTNTPKGKKSVALMEVRYNLGHLYQEMKLNDKAIEMYKSAIKMNHFNIDAYNNIGVIYFGNNQLDLAIEYYQKCLTMNPSYSIAYYNIGEAYLSKGLLDDAIMNFQIFLRYQPDYADAYTNIAKAFEKKGMLNQADEYYRKADRVKATGRNEKWKRMRSD